MYDIVRLGNQLSPIGKPGANLMPRVANVPQESLTVPLTYKVTASMKRDVVLVAAHLEVSEAELCRDIVQREITRLADQLRKKLAHV